MCLDVTVGSDNADNFAKFCQAQKLQFIIKDGLGKVICRLGCVLAQTMLTIEMFFPAQKSELRDIKGTDCGPEGGMWVGVCWLRRC